MIMLQRRNSLHVFRGRFFLNKTGAILFVKKKKAKRATKVFLVEDDAKDFLQDKGDKYEIEFRTTVHSVVPRDEPPHES